MRIQRTDLSARVGSYGRDHYLLIYSVMKGLSLANAAYVLSAILSGTTVTMSLLSLWTASFFALILTYITMLRGIILISQSVTWLDTVLPFVIGMLEFLLFSVLLPHERPLWHHWYLIFSLHALTAALLVWNRRRQICPADFEVELQDLIIEFDRWLRRDIAGAGGSFVLWISIWFVIQISFVPDIIIPSFHVFFGLLALGLMIAVITSAERDRSRIAAFILGDEGRQSPACNGSRKKRRGRRR